MTTPRLYAIHRIDHQPSRTHSWQVVIQRRKKTYTRQFSDGRHGGKAAALTAANAYRDQLLTRLAPLTRRDVCQITKKNNRSGISGLTRIDHVNVQRGRAQRHLFWVAKWPDLSGNAVQRKFAIRTYGEDRAFQLALQARRQGLRQLKTTPFQPRISGQ